MTQESKYLLCFTAKGLTHWYVIAILELPTVMTLMAYQTMPKQTLIELRCLRRHRTEPFPVEILLTLHYLNKIKEHQFCCRTLSFAVEHAGHALPWCHGKLHVWDCALLPWLHHYFHSFSSVVGWRVYTSFGSLSGFKFVIIAVGS